MSGLEFPAILEKVRAKWPEVTGEQSENGQAFLRAPTAVLHDLAHQLRNDPDLWFEATMDVTAYDRLGYPGATGNEIAVEYLLFSYKWRHKVALEVLVPRDACSIRTVSDIWPSALYFEREIFDLYGVHFEGHPSLERIMCPEDWVGYPLRKDYVYPAEYRGVPHLREGQHFENPPPRAPAPASGAATPTGGAASPPKAEGGESTGRAGEESANASRGEKQP